MSFPGFTPADFKVFDIDGFKPRMDAIKTRIRPKLEAIGRDLLPDVARIAGDIAFAHVARHARRTVNPPEDTWVAFALDKRGYKKHCHFKVAVSRGVVRFLFEAGPAHAQKRRWAAAWMALLAELGEEAAHPEPWRLTIGRPSEEAVPLLLGRAMPDYEARRLARRKRDLYVGFARAGLVAVAGVRDFVAMLEHLRVPRAIGTSASGFDVDRVLAAVGLRRAFWVIVTADDVVMGKPDPEVYELAAARLRVAPEACLVFEDSLVGIEAARRAGMRAVGVSTAHSDAELRDAGAERTIADFQGLEWPSLASP